MTIEHLIPTGLIVLASLIGYFVRTQMQRISDLEASIVEKLSEEETRQILSDKLDPVRENVQEIQNKLDQVITLLIKR